MFVGMDFDSSGTVSFNEWVAALARDSAEQLWCLISNGPYKLVEQTEEETNLVRLAL